MIVISVNELQAGLSMYLDEIGKGKQIIIQKNKKDIAMLSPVPKADWRDKMTIRPKLRVLPEEIVKPMTDVWEGVDDTEPMPLKNEMDDDLRPEYDLSKLKGGVRGKYASRYREGTNLVPLDPDVAAVFKDKESVNEALRLLIKIADAKDGKENEALEGMQD